MVVYDVVIIGGGQAGLAAARCLQRRGLEPVVLDANHRVGDSWRHRYDSLVLFTPSQYDSLPDLPFPQPPDTYPTKEDVADYLEDYARHHGIDVREDSRVQRLTRDETTGFFTAHLDVGTVHARQVVVATGALQLPALPQFAGALAPSIHQLHTSDYRNPRDVPTEQVVIVGAGNSGAQIAEELCEHRDTTICFGRLPRRLPQRLLGKDIFWWLERLGVMDRMTPPGGDPARTVGAIPLIGSRLPKLIRAGRVTPRARVVDARARELILADGSTIAPETVIWATGYRNDFSWIHVPGALDERGTPRHHCGVGDVQGMYFIGLPGLQTKGSAFLGFVGRDADHLAERIAQQARTIQSGHNTSAADQGDI